MPFEKIPKRGDNKRFSIIKRALGPGHVTRSITMDAPARLPKKGDKLLIKRSFQTPDPKIYLSGQVLEVINRTRKNPWNSRCTLGNLNVRAPDGVVSVWSNIEWMLVDGTLEYAS